MAGETRVVWEEEIHVRSYDVDSAGKLRLSSLFNYFQETAGKHATHLGAGYGVLKDRGLFWVLSRAKIRIHRLPAWGEHRAVDHLAQRTRRGTFSARAPADQ